MNLEERARLVEAARMLNYYLVSDKLAEHPIKLTPSERTATSQAYFGIQAVLAAPIAKAQAKVDQHELDKKSMVNTDLALVLFDEKGRPATQADANGKLIQVERDFKNSEPPMGDDDGIHPEDGEQLPLSQVPAGGWDIPSGVPANVESGLVSALQDGAGRTKAIETVQKATNLSKAVVEVHFDKLVKKGVIRKEGRNWVADEAEELPPPISDDPDVIATSETPGQGLIATTEPADAQAA